MPLFCIPLFFFLIVMHFIKVGEFLELVPKISGPRNEARGKEKNVYS